MNREGPIECPMCACAPVLRECEVVWGDEDSTGPVGYASAWYYECCGAKGAESGSPEGARVAWDEMVSGSGERIR